MVRQYSTLAALARGAETRAAEAATVTAERVMSGRPRQPWGPRVPWWLALGLAGFAAGLARRPR